MNYINCMLWVSILFQIISAFMWLVSALVKIPEKFTFPVIKPDMSSMGGNPPGGTYQGQAYSPELTEFTKELRKQAWLNKLAAISLGIGLILLVVAQALSCFSKAFAFQLIE